MSFTSVSLECVHKPEQPNQQESGGRARSLLFRADFMDKKIYEAGEQGLRRDWRECRAKLIRQCCSLCAVTHNGTVLYTVL